MKFEKSKVDIIVFNNNDVIITSPEYPGTGLPPEDILNQKCNSKKAFTGNEGAVCSSLQHWQKI